MTKEIFDYQQACEEVSQKRKILLDKFVNIMRLYYSHRQGYEDHLWCWSKYIANTSNYSEDSDSLQIDDEFGMVEYSHYCLTDSRSDPSDIVIRIPIKLFSLSDDELVSRAAKRKLERKRLFEVHKKRMEERREENKNRREYERYLELKKKYENR